MPTSQSHTHRSHARQHLGHLLALITLSLAAGAGAAGTAAGTSITNTATMSATDDAGNSSNASSSVTATVTQVYAVTVTPNGTTASPGQVSYIDTAAAAGNAVLTYTLSNPGNGTDNYTLSTAAVSSGTTAANVTYYLPASGDTSGVYNASTAVKVTGPVQLAADASTKFFAVYPVAKGVVGGTSYDITPQGQSQGTAASGSAPSGPSDSDNLGRVTETNDYNLTFAASETGTITSSTSASKVYTSTLTNTGNVPLKSSDLTLSASASDTTSGGGAISTSGAFAQSYSASYNGTTASGSTPQAAVNALLANGASLPAGGAITLSTTVTDDGKRAAGDKDTLSLGASVTSVTSGTGVTNNASTATTIIKTTTVVKGASSISKTQALCGQSGSTAPGNCPASSGTSQGGINVRPGDYVEYYLSASNTGTSALFNTRVTDAIPAGVAIYSVGATVTGASGTLYYSTDGSSWTTDPTTLTVTGGSTTLYVGLDTNGDKTITAADTFAAGAKILFRIKVKVNDGGAPQSAPVSDSQTVS